MERKAIFAAYVVNVEHPANGEWSPQPDLAMLLIQEHARGFRLVSITPIAGSIQRADGTGDGWCSVLVVTQGHEPPIPKCECGHSRADHQRKLYHTTVACQHCDCSYEALGKSPAPEKFGLEQLPPREELAP